MLNISVVFSVLSDTTYLAVKMKRFKNKILLIVITDLKNEKLLCKGNKMSTILQSL